MARSDASRWLWKIRICGLLYDKIIAELPQTGLRTADAELRPCSGALHCVGGVHAMGDMVFVVKNSA
ncbi:hypothetical protein F0Q58_01495 [Anaplasma marginale]|nr:hypothetical protein F0Q58_01495 [Anaplasma marginale]KAB0450697.1 hypothetical protein FY210_03165 [Anaplasma marginale]